MIAMPQIPEKQTAINRDSSAILRMQEIFISVPIARTMVKDLSRGHKNNSGVHTFMQDSVELQIQIANFYQ